LDDALLVGGDAGEIGAVEDRVLKGAGLQPRLFGLLRLLERDRGAGTLGDAAGCSGCEIWIDDGRRSDKTNVR
jgi:hypothetical protein